MVQEITTSEFDSNISSGICVVKFWSEFCGPCKNYAVIFNNFANKNKEVKCFSIDAINNPEIAKRFDVRRVPFTIVFNDGNEISRLQGVQSLGQLEESVRI